MPRLDGDYIPPLPGPALIPNATIAITLFELERVPTDLRAKAFVGRLEFRPQYMVKLNRENFPGVVFKGLLLPDAIACDIVRKTLRSQNETIPGVYLLRKTSWERIRDVDDLTILTTAGEPMLNPAVFGEPEPKYVPQVGGQPPPVKSIAW